MDTSIQELLKQLAVQISPHTESPQLDSQVLVAHHLGKPRSWVLAHPEISLSVEKVQQIQLSAKRMTFGEPLPYILGHWEFFGLDFAVTPDVLIPRPETELIVDTAIRWLQQHPDKRRAVDVGTGSGCIGIAIARHVIGVHMLLSDISNQALEIARQNAEKHKLLDQLQFSQTDLLDGIAGPLDLICANLPYIPTGKLEHLPVARSEPRLALDGGNDGVDVIGQLLAQARGLLVSGGLMLLEIEAYEGNQVKAIAQSTYPQSKVDILQDLAGLDRCVKVERPDRIVHLCTPREWVEQSRLDEFRDDSLAQAGFIHCSQPEQIFEVANRYYRTEPELVVLWIDPHNLASELRWEPAGDSYYPHVYGPVNLDAIEAASPLRPGSDGIFR